MECKQSAASQNHLPNAKRQNSLRFRINSRLNACDISNYSNSSCGSNDSQSSMENITCNNNINKTDKIHCHQEPQRLQQTMRNYDDSLGKKVVKQKGKCYTGIHNSDTDSCHGGSGCGSSSESCSSKTGSEQKTTRSLRISVQNIEPGRDSNPQVDSSESTVYGIRLRPRTGNEKTVLFDNDVITSSDHDVIPKILRDVMNRSTLSTESVCGSSQEEINRITSKQDVASGILWLQQQISRLKEQDRQLMRQLFELGAAIHNARDSCQVQRVEQNSPCVLSLTNHKQKVFDWPSLPSVLPKTGDNLTWSGRSSSSMIHGKEKKNQTSVCTKSNKLSTSMHISVAKNISSSVTDLHTSSAPRNIATTHGSMDSTAARCLSATELSHSRKLIPLKVDGCDNSVEFFV